MRRLAFGKVPKKLPPSLPTVANRYERFLLSATRPGEAEKNLRIRPYVPA